MRFLAVGLLFALSIASIGAQETPVPIADSAPKSEMKVKGKVITSLPPDAARLETLNKLDAERLTQETNGLRAEVAKLKLERELITERLALEAAKRKEAVKDAVAKSEFEIAELNRSFEASRLRSEKLKADQIGRASCRERV